MIVRIDYWDNKESESRYGVEALEVEDRFAIILYNDTRKETIDNRDGNLKNISAERLYNGV